MNEKIFWARVFQCVLPHEEHKPIIRKGEVIGYSIKRIRKPLFINTQAINIKQA